MIHRIHWQCDDVNFLVDELGSTLYDVTVL